MRKSKNYIIKILLLFIEIFLLYEPNKVFSSNVKNNQTIDDGVYIIKSALNENFVFDIAGISEKNGANLELWENNKGENQKFKVKHVGEGYYTISPVHSNKRIDVENNSKELCANVLQWQNNEGDNQKWLIKEVSNGYYNIISKCNDLYLDIPYSNASNGSNVQMWFGNGGKNQMFKFEKYTGRIKSLNDGIYSLKPAWDNNSAIDIYGSSLENKGNVVVWQSNSGANQKFIINYQSDGYYTLAATHSGKYMDIEGASNKDGANVLQWEYNNQDNQKWIIEEDENGYYSIISKLSGMYLTTSSGNICVSKKNDSKNQKFKIDKAVSLQGKQAISNGKYIISTALSDQFVFDIPNSSKSDGALLEIWKNGFGRNQIFEITHIGDGFYSIKAEHSGKAIEVTDGKIQFNTKVQQKTFNSSDAQKWIIQDAGNGYYNIISKCCELYMEVTEGKAQNGEIIKVSNFNNSNAQKFKLNDIKSFIKMSKGNYGKSGLKIKGDNRGSDLIYYQYGDGPNVFFATFSVHGFEDKWYQDGTELTQIANGFWENLTSSNNLELAKKWTIYIFPDVNPDGRKYGWTNNGPGRTTLYSQAPGNKGIDLNRCWSSNFVYQSNDRNYTGTEPFQAYEARYLREFLLSHKSQNGQTVLVDLHGWTQQLIGDGEIRNYYRQQFPENTDTPTYGKGYLIGWARNNLGSNTRTARSALIELPSYINSSSDVITYRLKEKYINATLSMLSGIN